MSTILLGQEVHLYQRWEVSEGKDGHSVIRQSFLVRRRDRWSGGSSNRRPALPPGQAEIIGCWTGSELKRNEKMIKAEEETLQEKRQKLILRSLEGLIACLETRKVPLS